MAFTGYFEIFTYIITQPSMGPIITEALIGSHTSRKVCFFGYLRYVEFYQHMIAINTHFGLQLLTDLREFWYEYS